MHSAGKLTREEAREQRWTAYLDQLAKVDQRHEGWTNAATLMARIYLSQEMDFHAWLEQHRRRDGTVDAEKVAKWFIQSGLQLEDWVFESPIPAPEEFADRSHGYRPRVNWQEIADSFSAKAMGLL